MAAEARAMRLSFNVVSSIWTRDMLHLSRQKSRILYYLFSPVFLLAFLGLGFRRIDVLPEMNMDYLSYLTPGMMGMTLLTASNSTSFLLLWDREMGFLKEIMVTPTSRLSIILGRASVGITNALIQGLMLLIAGLIMGMKLSGISGILLCLPFIILIASTFIGMGLIIASFIKDTQSFNLAQSFALYPIIFFSGAFYPVDRFPAFIATLAYINPLTYGVDGLRFSLLGVSSFNPALDLSVMTVSCVAMFGLGAYRFEVGGWE
jgi:ABC-2 type transport system permease protein